MKLLRCQKEVHYANLTSTTWSLQTLNASVTDDSQPVIFSAD